MRKKINTPDLAILNDVFVTVALQILNSLGVLKRCLRPAQAVNGSCACTCFVIIAQTSFLLLSIRLRKMASASNESCSTKEKDSAKKQMWSATEEEQLLTTCSGIEISKQLDTVIASLQAVYM